MKDEKILSEEILSEEQLEQVSGGTSYQLNGDYDFLKSFGYLHEGNGWNSVKMVNAAWASVGVTCKTYVSDCVANKYFLGDKQVSRKDAFRHVMKKRGWNQIAIDCFDFDRYNGDF